MRTSQVKRKLEEDSKDSDDGDDSIVLAATPQKPRLSAQDRLLLDRTMRTPDDSKVCLTFFSFLSKFKCTIPYVNFKFGKKF